MDGARRRRVSEEALRRLATAVRTAQLYAPGHPLVQRALSALAETVTQLLADHATVAIGVIGDKLVIGDMPLTRSAEACDELKRRLQALGVERVSLERGVTAEALATLVWTLAAPERTSTAAAGPRTSEPLAALQSLPRITVGRIRLEERVDTSAADLATIRKLYADAVSMAEALWDSAQCEGQPDPVRARQLVDDLAHAVAQNRTALVALTALKEYDNYTFTHMVNVSILTMAQARALGIEGTLLRDFGLAGLMHDIGKVRTPLGILTKPDKLTDEEFAIMRLHVIDGAEILRGTPDMPPLAAVVAFEHHLRLDGSGYPVGLTRSTLNLATMLCSIADVYDAMRAQREYQEAFPTDRILAVLQRNNGTQFDPHLVKRFSQLMGIYPPGTLVRLSTGAIAVVLKVYAPDPYRPRVRVIADAAAHPLPRPYDQNLWAHTDTLTGLPTVVSPLDGTLVGIDPLHYL
jgi:putative nucleotidyltransferase with HDIG domain